MTDSDRTTGAQDSGKSGLPLPVEIEGEPRIRDVALGARLGFAKPASIRDLIKRHKAALEQMGVLPTVRKTPENNGLGGAPATEFYLNRKQAVFITAKSETPTATEITIEVIEKFDAYERGRVRAPALVSDDPIIATMQQLIAVRETQLDHQKRIEALEQKALYLPAPATHFTILAFANLNGIELNARDANRMGRRAAQMTLARGLVIQPVQDDRYGTVGSYPRDVLEDVFVAAGHGKVKLPGNDPID